MTQEITRIVSWLDQQLAVSGARGFVVGLSGGLDSAVVSRLCQLARSENTVGVIMPCYSEPQDEADARLVADHFATTVVRVDLADTYDALLEGARPMLGPLLVDQEQPHDDLRARLPIANLKPRLRMTTLYFVANSMNYLVAGTGNRSELAIGYFTKYGDGGADILPIGHLLKSEVRALAREMGMPGRIIEKAPSAGLWLGQTDEAEMGFSYEELERYLEQGAQAVSPAVAMKIERLVRASEHKRNPVPIIR